MISLGRGIIAHSPGAVRLPVCIMGALREVSALLRHGNRELSHSPPELPGAGDYSTRGGRVQGGGRWAPGADAPRLYAFTPSGLEYESSPAPSRDQRYALAVHGHESSLNGLDLGRLEERLAALGADPRGDRL